MTLLVHLTFKIFYVGYSYFILCNNLEMSGKISLLCDILEILGDSYIIRFLLTDICSSILILCLVLGNYH